MESGLNAETAGIVVVVVGFLRLLELLIGKFVYKDKEGELHAHIRKVHDDVKEIKLLLRYGHKGDRDG